MIVYNAEISEALGLYRQVYEKYPHVGWGSSSLMMIGICHHHLGDNAKAIEFYRKALRKLPTGWEGVVQFYLGAAYADNGQTDDVRRLRPIHRLVRGRQAEE